MMEFIRKNPPVIAIIAIVLVFLLLVVFSLARKSDPATIDPNAHKSQAQTTLSSPFAQTTDTLAVNYGSDIDPNIDTVKQSFRIFAPDRLPLAQLVRRDLEALLPDLLQRAVIPPTYPLTFAQIDPNSVACNAANSCTMLVYIDSPERLFELKTDYSSGVPNFTLTEKPWEGLQQ